MKSGIVAVTLLGCAMAFTAAAAPPADWRLAKDSDGIRVYLRKVEGSQYQAYRGVVEIRADISTLSALQDDPVGACRWVFACAEMRLLKQNRGERWTYTRIAMPWPVQDRDVVIHLRDEPLADGLVRHLQGEPDFIAERQGLLRVPSLSGQWRMRTKSPGVTEVIYEAQSEPGGSIPAWLANSFVVDAPFNTLKNLRSVAEADR